MTPKERELLAYLRTYVAEHEFSPSYGECAEALGIVSKSGVLRLARALQRQGCITMEPYRGRSMLPTSGNPPNVRVVLDAVTKAHGFDDGEGLMITCTPDELRTTLIRALG